LRVYALGLLFLLVLSITPKSFLHEIFAHHSDVTACTDANVTGPCIHKQGYNCQQTDLVVPSLYEMCVVTITVQPPVGFSTSTELFSSSILQQSVSGISGRGPPSHV
jgi:hypothetical protein